MRINWKESIGKTINGFSLKDYKRENKKTKMLVACPVCGKDRWMSTTDILDPRVKSCGCIRAKTFEDKTKDLEGKKFGYIKVIKKDNTQKSKSGRSMWICECTACGKILTIPRQKLIQGIIKSCGCMQHKIKPKNNTDISGQTFNSIKAIRCVSGNGCEAIWECECLLCGKIFTRRRTKLGRDISCGCYASKLNSANLADKVARVDGTSAAIIASTKIYKTNTSGIRGVSYYSSQEKWVAYIAFKGKKYHLGYFETKEEAGEARKVAESKLYGDFLQWYAEEHPEKWKRINKRI